MDSFVRHQSNVARSFQFDRILWKPKMFDVLKSLKVLFRRVKIMNMIMERGAYSRIFARQFFSNEFELFRELRNDLELLKEWT